jgi:ferredoxin-2, mitochondrial
MPMQPETIQLVILDRELKEHHIPVPLDIDLNLMEVAKAEGLPVEGTCGGMALCASCHVYVQSEHSLPEPTADELAMLDQAFFVEESSRLACQIKIISDLDGLKVALAPVSE